MVECLVLILVLMEYGLRGNSVVIVGLDDPRLNPCFNGIWSARAKRLTVGTDWFES